MKKRLSFLIVLTITFNYGNTQIPSGYYNTATGTGFTLKTQLHNIIDNHTTVSYSALWTHYNNTDIDPDDGFIWDMYSENPSGTDPYNYIHGTNQCGNFSIEGDCYNREHSFPKSWFNDASPMFSDIHHVVPTDGKVNGQRSNHPYGEVGTPTWTSQNGSKLGPSSISGYSGTVFEPIDEYKGDFARIYFYMATRYEDVLSSWSSDMLDGSTDQVFATWALDMLIDWHNNDPVSQKETDRNDEIYDNVQGNRNPFIDHPEYVNTIWGGGCSGEPTIQVNNVNVSGVSANSVTLNWTIGNGSNRLAVIKQGSAVTFVPVNSSTYSGISSDFSTAQDQGNGNFIVYNETGSSVVISGLSAQTNYHIQIFEFCNDNPSYLNTNAPNLNFTTSSLISNNSIVITEVMYNSTSLDEEWIEIYNASGASITLDANWSLSNSNPSWMYSFDGTYTILNGDYATIQVGSSGAFPFAPDINFGSSTNQLVNSTSTIDLSYNGSTIDEVTYDDGDQSSTDGSGPSYELTSFTVDNASTSSGWGASAVNGGSPGFKNSTDVTIIWDGEMSDAWSAAMNWDGNTLPLSTDKVIIPNMTNDPIISTDIEVSTLNILSGAVIDISDKSLKIMGDLVLNGSMTVASGASLLPLGTIEGSGNATIHRNTTFGISDGQYSAIGSPIQSGSTSSLGSIVYSYDETIAYDGGGTDGSDRFVLVSTPETISQGDAYFSANTGNISFVGTPNGGDENITLIYDETTDVSATFAGFNLVSNPYPAAISYDNLMGGNTDIGTTLYFWDDGGSDVSQRTNSDYITATSMAAAGGGANARTGDWDGNIRSAQGFFVKATTAGTLSFTPSMMVTGNNTDAGFFRTAKPILVRLALSNNDLSTNIVVGFTEEATLGFDRTLDGHKIKGNNNLQLYSRMNEEILAIQALPILTEDITIDLGFDISESGTYNFDLPEELTYNFGVFLIDHKLDRVINLLEVGSYTFESETTNNSDRFSLLFSPNRILSIDDAKLTNNQLVVFSNSSLLNIRVNQILDNATIKIYDLSGNLVKKITQVDFNGEDLQTRFNRQGLFIMTIQANDQFLVKRFNHK